MIRQIDDSPGECNLALSVCLACMVLLTNPGSLGAQVISSSQAELVKIALKSNFCLTLKFNAFPEYAFHLWLPELAIFDSDLDRSKAPDPIDGIWLARRQGNLLVKGRLTSGNKRMDFKCTLKPRSMAAIMLELEVSNSGQVDWTDYAQLAVCLAPAESNHAFSDSTGARTYINSQNAGIIPITRSGIVDDFNHYAVVGHSDHTDSIQRAMVRDGFVARQNYNGNIGVSFMWQDAARVDVNPGGLDCIHSHPAVGPLKAGDSKSLYGFILIEEGTAEEHYTIINDLIDQNRNN